MEGGLHFGLQHVVQEGGHAVFGILGMTGHGPHGGAADHGVLGSAFHVGPVGQNHDAPVELGAGLHGGVGTGGVHENAGFTGSEGVDGFGLAAHVHGNAFLVELGEEVDVLDLQGTVELKFGVKAVEAVVVGGKGNVVPGGEAFKLHPGLPAARHAVLARAGFLDLAGEVRHFGPGTGEVFGVAAGLLHGVLVVVENRGGGVEGHGDELAVARGVVARHGRQELGHVEGRARGFHDFPDGTDGTLGGHHAGGAHFEDLNDVRMLLGAEGGNGGGHGFVVVALVHALDFVLVLRSVEVLDDVVGDLTEFTAHAVPEGNGGLGLHGSSKKHQRDGQKGH